MVGRCVLVRRCIEREEVLLCERGEVLILRGRRPGKRGGTDLDSATHLLSRTLLWQPTPTPLSHPTPTLPVTIYTHTHTCRHFHTSRFTLNCKKKCLELYYRQFTSALRTIRVKNAFSAPIWLPVQWDRNDSERN